MAEVKIPRRDFLKSAGAAAPRGRRWPPASPHAARMRNHRHPAPEPEIRLTLTQTEWAFISAAVDTLIPADELTPSGTDVGLVVFIDRQLAARMATARGFIARARSFAANAPELVPSVADTRKSRRIWHRYGTAWR